jgi:hypothetical protein
LNSGGWCEVGCALRKIGGGEVDENAGKRASRKIVMGIGGAGR